MPQIGSSYHHGWRDFDESLVGQNRVHGRLLVATLVGHNAARMDAMR
jgi:hypothetical protein